MYSFLPGKELVSIYSDDNTNDQRVFNGETVIALDTGDIGRLGKRAKIFNNAIHKINIDHHPTNTYFAEMNYICENASATGEIIFQLIKAMDIKFDVDIALCLYTAILTDTGGFKYSNTTSLTHLIVSQLVSYGIDISAVSFRIFDSISENKLKLIGSAINTIELFENGKIALITITKKMIADSGAIEEETEGIVDYARNISGVEVAAFVKEKFDNEVKVSLRSNSYIDVSQIVNKYSGGGHKRAAGCTLNTSLLETKKIILNDLIKAVKSRM